jgi:hypothetical protein
VRFKNSYGAGSRYQTSPVEDVGITILPVEITIGYDAHGEIVEEICRSGDADGGEKFPDDAPLLFFFREDCVTIKLSVEQEEYHVKGRARIKIAGPCHG